MTILITLYLLMGLAFGLWFFFTGHGVIDNSSVASAWYTRLLLTPAAILLWPLLLTKVLRGKS
jgi:hypothetical protein